MSSQRRSLAAIAASFILVSTILVVGCQQESPAGPSVTVTDAMFAKRIKDPKVNSTDPPSAPQNITLDVRVLGSGFVDGSNVTFTLDGGDPGPLFQTISTAFVSTKELVAKVTIAATAAIDLYDVVVVTPGPPGKKGVGADLFAVTAKQATLTLSGGMVAPAPPDTDPWNVKVAQDSDKKLGLSMNVDPLPMILMEFDTSTCIPFKNINSGKVAEGDEIDKLMFDLGKDNGDPVQIEQGVVAIERDGLVEGGASTTSVGHTIKIQIQGSLSNTSIQMGSPFGDVLRDHLHFPATVKWISSSEDGVDEFEFSGSVVIKGQVGNGPKSNRLLECSGNKVTAIVTR